MVLNKSVPVPENHKKKMDKFVNPALNNALKQEEATWGNVQGQVSQALMGTVLKILLQEA